MRSIALSVCLQRAEFLSKQYRPPDPAQRRNWRGGQSNKAPISSW
jgi:hypothetical protein